MHFFCFSQLQVVCAMQELHHEGITWVWVNLVRSFVKLLVVFVLFKMKQKCSLSLFKVQAN